MLRDPVLEPEALETGRCEHDGVVVAALQPLQASGYVAAQLEQLQVRAGRD